MFDYQDIYQQFDYQIGHRTVLGPETAGAAVLHTTESKPHLWVAVSTACITENACNRPQYAASLSVLKAARMIAAVGGAL